MPARRTQVYVEADFSVKNVRDETTGQYNTQILATHGASLLSLFPPSLTHRLIPGSLTDRLVVLKKPSPREDAAAEEQQQ